MHAVHTAGGKNPAGSLCHRIANNARCGLTLFLLAACLPAAVCAADQDAATDEATAKLIATITAVGGNGEGNVPAVQALKELQKQPASAIVPVLSAFSEAGIISQNLLRSAVESIADSTVDAGSKLPVEELTAFVEDTDHHPRARRLAFELVKQSDETKATELLQGLLTDPSPELRDYAMRTLSDSREGRIQNSSRGD